MCFRSGFPAIISALHPRHFGRGQQEHERAELAHILDLFGEDSWRVFMRVNSRCAHQVRPPFGPVTVRRAPMRLTSLGDSRK